MFLLFKDITKAGACLGVALFDMGALLRLSSEMRGGGAPMKEIGTALTYASLVLVVLCIAVWY